jgi:DNA-directed RNA polymerase subunit alpha
MEQSTYTNWRALIRPREAHKVEGFGNTYGKFVIQPLERGFGTTVGNALRRVMLSSLQGAAVTSVHIDGILHEFAYIPGIVEDVTDVVLNIKGVLLKLSSTSEVHGRVSRRGEAGKTVVVRAGDMVFDAACEVLNPDHKLCTLTEDGELTATVNVMRGRGYVPASQNKSEEQPIGTIPVDAIFSPIQRVRYAVTNTRVGDRTDYEALTIEVWTDGSVLPADALAYAAKIVKEQVQIFVGFAEQDEPAQDEGKVDEPDWNPWLAKRVDELELSVRSQNCLQNAGIEFIYQLVEKTEAEMLKTKNFGRKSLNEIKEILGDLQLSLGMKLNGFPRNKVG